MIKGSIDIGSNSCLLLIAEVREGKVIQVLKSISNVTGLGRELDKNKVFLEVSMKETYEALKSYVLLCKEFNIAPEEIIATATEASRVAENSKDFYLKIKKELGLDVRIITGDEEAYFSTKGVLCDSYSFPLPLFILDIGGASTEIIKIDKNKEISLSYSMPFGSVRITNWREENSLDENVSKIVKTFSEELKASKTLFLCCVAGTMTSLANMFLKNKKFIEDEVHGVKLKASDVRYMRERYQNYSPAEFLEEFPFLGKRSSSIWGGLYIISRLIDLLGVEVLYISTYGLRYGTLVNGKIN